MAKYRVTKGKAYEDGKEIPVGYVFDVADGDEVPAFLVGKVELVPEELVEELVEELTEKPVDKPVDKPAVDKPAVDKPAVDKPAVDKPAVDKK